MKKVMVPFAFEMYGYIEVEAKNRDDAHKKAEEILEKMSVSDMLACSDYLQDSEEIDEEGIIKMADGSICSY